MCDLRDAGTTSGDGTAGSRANPRLCGRSGFRREAIAWRDQRIAFEAVLSRVQPVIAPVGPQQLFVRTALDDFTVLEHENLIGAADRRKPMGDHERGPSPSERVEPILN